MRPLRVYTTVRDGDVIRVLAGGQTAASPAPVADSMHIVIAGAGAAGSFAAAELRRDGFGGRVTLLTSEERLPYDKPNLSKDYLAGRAPDDWIPLRAEEDYESDGIELRLRTSVESIDPAAGRVRLTSGEQIAFDRLILATGARARQLGVPAASDARIFYLRTWSDADALRAAAGTAQRVVVIGASFIGLETAASLRDSAWWSSARASSDSRPRPRCASAASRSRSSVPRSGRSNACSAARSAISSAASTSLTASAFASDGIRSRSAATAWCSTTAASRRASSSLPASASSRMSRSRNRRD
jgi:2-polyprenyl-6-methoxyphenol hydroxylase-like FAD-dependent oxidoreductase